MCSAKHQGQAVSIPTFCLGGCGSNLGPGDGYHDSSFTGNYMKLLLGCFIGRLFLITICCHVVWTTDSIIK
jgi:hypothetical protein